jgi:hypothetical protein
MNWTAFLIVFGIAQVILSICLSAGLYNATDEEKLRLSLLFVSGALWIAVGVGLWL